MSSYCRGQPGIGVKAGDYEGRSGMGKVGGSSGGQLGTTPVMSHFINLAGIDGPSARIIVSYSRSSLYPLRGSPS